MAIKVTNSEIFDAMESWAPLSLAYDWDNVGLQIGSFEQSAKRVLVTLDVTEAVVDEAIDQHIDLIIAHHPLFFKPLKQININSVKGKIIHKCILNNISVYAAHTNLDIADNGVNDILCEQLDVQVIDHLIHLQNEQLVKLVVYIPTTHVDQLRNALGSQGAGHIGNYSHCTFQTEGNGTFKPLKGSTPYIGTENELETVSETKVETIVKKSDLSNVLLKMKEAHPYEEPAYDLYAMENKGKSIGLGRIGNLKKGDMTLQSVADQVKQVFNQSHVRIIGEPKRLVNKVALLGGSGEKYIHQAKQKGADVYITGDMSFHQAQDAMEMGLAVIDAGHYIESAMKKAVQKFLQDKFDHSIEIFISDTNTDPFLYV
ncbi:Nif3-like dinuclear metal center hexameric protein [Virgibacillus sp. W0430]|uniref:Nif3-like dinuclear metal center hexameric protein n=1 Tax=Virgibacillus sp. W0430 TaxID=3391580 RepID=UPI003F45AB69